MNSNGQLMHTPNVRATSSVTNDYVHITPLVDPAQLDAHAQATVTPIPVDTTDRFAALEDLVHQLAGEIVPATSELLQSHTRADFLDRISSRKFLVTVATVLTTLATWLHGNVSGSLAAPIIAAVTMLYIVLQAVIDQKGA